MEINLELFLEAIRQLDIDLVVIAGDYFDYKLQLNSPSAITAIHWFDRFINVCKESGVKKIRIIKGTQDHDNDQLEVFRSYEDDITRIFTHTTSEETLPNLRCIYCPDELMNLSDYHQTYYPEFYPTPDIGFFHGNFDTILPKIEYDRIQDNQLKIMIYEYEKFSKLIKGPLISGHWHTRCNHKSLYYVGSYDRWKFGEETDKSFIYGQYNTENSQYYIHEINNILAKKYETIIVRDEDFTTPQEYANLIQIINTKLKDDFDSELRILYMITGENDEAKLNFSAFQKKFINNKRVKIDIKDLYKKQMKKENNEKRMIESTKYQYIFEKSIPLSEKIHTFILDKKGIDIPLNVIDTHLKKYLNK